MTQTDGAVYLLFTCVHTCIYFLYILIAVYFEFVEVYKIFLLLRFSKPGCRPAMRASQCEMLLSSDMEASRRKAMWHSFPIDAGVIY